MTVRLGVFGGTFDPPHVGHLAAARAARDAAGLDAVLFVPAGRPWQKTGTVLASPEDRVRMTMLATDDDPGFTVSRLEVDRPGPTYTVDTLEALHTQEPDATLVLILGADAAAGLPTWRSPDRICELAELAVVVRPGAPMPAPLPGCRVVTVEMPPVPVSSTEVRARLDAGLPVDDLVPSRVAAYLRREGPCAAD